MSADDYNRLRECCITKTQSCLATIYESLQSGTLDPFYLDDDGLSGLDYLLMPDADGHGSGYFLTVSLLYRDLLVKSIDLYYKNDPNDPILHRNLQKICTDPKLFQALEERLRREVGILLHTYCKPAKPADGTEVMKGTYADADADADAEVPSSLPLAERMEHGIAIPVSPERNFVIEREEELYERQPMPPDLRAYREAEKRGGLRKKKTQKVSKKASKTRTNKRSKNKTNKRSKNKTNKRRYRKP